MVYGLQNGHAFLRWAISRLQASSAYLSQALLRLLEGCLLRQVRGGALLDGKLEEYEAAWQAAGGEDISTQALGDLFKRLGQPLDAYR